MPPDTDGAGNEILIVEPSLTQALKLQHLLKQHHYTVRIARDGESALLALENGLPALCLSELLLPDMDGYALCRRIKAAEPLQNVPVVLLSPLADPEEVLRLLECGADGFIVKPYDEPSLLARLHEVRRNQTSRASGEVFFAGRRHSLSVSHTAPVLGLLLCAYEIAVRRSREPSRETAAPESEAETDQKTPTAPPLRILLAEDSAVNRRLAVHILEKQGYAVVAAGNGREALDALEKQRCDLILMDVEMPEMGGLEATAAIRARERERGGHVPILAMTAHSGEEIRERCRAAGMDGYVSKPLEVRELLAAVDGLARNPPPAPVVDRAEVLKRVGQDRTLLGEIIALFFEETPDLLAEIGTAITGRDAGALERAAHALKGSVGTFGARAAFEAALNLEMLGHSGDFSDAEAARAALESEIARLRPALAALRDAPPAD